MRTQKKPQAGEQGAGKRFGVCLQNRASEPVCQACQQIIKVFFKPGEVIELRALGLNCKGPWEGLAKGTVSGYFNNPDKFAAAAKSLDDLERATGIYFTLNPVEPALLARANNRLIVPKNTTADEQIVCHRWFLIDTDPERPAGISATDAELEAAINCRNEIADYLHKNGWLDPIKAYSGNGGHLLYRLPDMPNSTEIAELKKQALKALNHKFGNDGVHVDPTVCNASRITKLYGTLARKGDSLEDRPHRRSYLEEIPDPIVPVTLEQLRWLASLAPKEKTDSYVAKPQAGTANIGKEKYAKKVLESCCEKIRQSTPGDQHHIRRDMARLIGGYLQYINESEILSKFEQAVVDSGAQDMRAAMKTVRDGLEYGRLSPIAIPDIESAQAHSPGQVETQDDLLDFEIAEKPHLDLTKFSGITKAFVELATRNSEADLAAVLFTFLARFGVEIGRKPFFSIGDTTHHGRLAVVIVGDSAKSRKGTSGKPVSRLMSYKSLLSSIEYKFARTSPGPFSSGEGIIYAVRDPIEAWDRKKQATEIIDPGIDDKRLFVLDEEFGGVLTNTKREGNTLSMVIRCSWDSGRFDPLTKNSKISATGAHVGWVSHITNYELKAKLPECEGFNGFANRILWVFSLRQKIVPMPEPMPEKELAELQHSLLSILNNCHECEREIIFDEQAKEAWIDEYYQKLTSQNENGLLGVLLNRSEAQVRRLALLFTLLDGENKTSLEHLNQAMAAWQYCEDSACYIFKGQAQDSVARKISQTLQEKERLTGTEIRDLFLRNVKRDRIQRAIEELIATDTAEMILQPTGGRPLNILKIKYPYDKNDINDKRSDNKADERLKSFKSFLSLRDLEKKPDEQEFEDFGAGCSDCDEDILS
jgi:hypothetical protein